MNLIKLEIFRRSQKKNAPLSPYTSITIYEGPIIGTHIDKPIVFDYLLSHYSLLAILFFISAVCTHINTVKARLFE